MTLAPFTDRAARLNRAVEAHLSNATATFEGGEPFGVTLTRASDRADPFAPAIDAAELTVSYCVANTPGVCQGRVLVIDGQAHKVAGQVQPDAGGWVTLAVFPAD